MKNTFNFIVSAIHLVLIKKNPEMDNPMNTKRTPLNAGVQRLGRRMRAKPWSPVDFDHLLFLKRTPLSGPIGTFNGTLSKQKRITH